MAASESSTANKRASIASISTIASNASISSTASKPALPRRESSVQLVPHSHSPTYFDQPLTPSEQRLVAETESRFDDLDLSSKDFDFDDVFTFDRPQRKIPRVVEVSSSSREQRHPGQRDWSYFSFSHYGAAANPRARAANPYKPKPGMAGMQRELGLGIGAAYLRNQQLLHKERR